MPLPGCRPSSSSQSVWTSGLSLLCVSPKHWRCFEGSDGLPLPLVVLRSRTGGESVVWLGVVLDPVALQLGAHALVCEILTPAPLPLLPLLLVEFLCATLGGHHVIRNVGLGWRARVRLLILARLGRAQGMRLQAVACVIHRFRRRDSAQDLQRHIFRAFVVALQVFESVPDVVDM